MDIVQAWELWDETPGDPVVVRRKEDALAAEAARMYTTASSLHDEVTRLRGLGLSVKQAWVQIELDFEYEWAMHNA